MKCFVFIDVLVHVQCVCNCVFVCVINPGRKSRPRWSFASHYDREEEKEEGLDAANGADITNCTPLENSFKELVAITGPVEPYANGADITNPTPLEKRGTC